MTLSHGEWLKSLLESAKVAMCELKRPPVFVDIGARDGLSQTWDLLARLGQITAIGFEPDEDHCGFLTERDPHVTYIRAALADRTGELPFYLTRMPGCSSLRQPNQELLGDYPASVIFDLVGTTSISVTTLDTMIEQQAVPVPDFLKLDTQGFEFEILSGAVRCLDSVSAIELEAQFKPMYKGQALLADIKDFLEGHGFILRSLIPNGPYEGEMLEVDAYFSRRPALDDKLALIRLWQLATELDSPYFLSQMKNWQPDWLSGLSQQQIELRRFLFGS